MNNTYSLYEGDSVIRPGPKKYSDIMWKFEPTVELPHSSKTDGAELDIARIEREAHNLRREVAAALIQRFWQRLEAWSNRGARRSVDAFLAKATDHADLERRLRELEHPRAAFN